MSAELCTDTNWTLPNLSPVPSRNLGAFVGLGRCPRVAASLASRDESSLVLAFCRGWHAVCSIASDEHHKASEARPPRASSAGRAVSPPGVGRSFHLGRSLPRVDSRARLVFQRGTELFCP